MSSTKVLKNPPQTNTFTLGKVYRNGVYEERDAYQKMRCLEEFGPNYDDESDECNNPMEWGKADSNGNYTSR